MKEITLKRGDRIQAPRHGSTCHIIKVHSDNERIDVQWANSTTSWKFYGSLTSEYLNCIEEGIYIMDDRYIDLLEV